MKNKKQRIGEQMENKFTTPQSLNTAVLFLVFNRLDTTKQVFKVIRKAKPKRFYIAADGARKTKIEEKTVVDNIRHYILNNIDWECEVKTLFREENLGCKNAVSSAIDWFFSNEEMGIILEDDVVPTETFFYFCEQMLNEYKEDERIMMISGTNYYLDIRNEIEKDYFFSRHFTIWGWATWRRAWSKYDVTIPSWREEINSKDVAYISSEKYIVKHFENTFDLINKDKMDTWDIQWVYTCLFNYGLCLTPSINMISNIGVDGTHTTGNVTDSHFLKSFDFENINRIKLNKLVYPEQYYDGRLHIEKTLPAYRQNIMIAVLKKLKLYYILKKVYKLFK